MEKILTRKFEFFLQQRKLTLLFTVLNLLKLPHDLKDLKMLVHFFRIEFLMCSGDFSLSPYFIPTFILHKKEPWCIELKNIFPFYILFSKIVGNVRVIKDNEEGESSEQKRQIGRNTSNDSSFLDLFHFLYICSIDKKLHTYTHLL